MDTTPTQAELGAKYIKLVKLVGKVLNNHYAGPTTEESVSALINEYPEIPKEEAMSAYIVAMATVEYMEKRNPTPTDDNQTTGPR